MFGLFKLLPVGTQAPDFTLPGVGPNGPEPEPVSLASFKEAGKSVILVFYPADFTPVCTAQLCEMNDTLINGLSDDTTTQKHAIAVLGINPGKAATHQKFAAEHRLGFPLLVDEGAKVASLYKAVLVPGLVNNRAVYGIDPQGIIRFAQFGKPTVQKVLEVLYPSAI